MYILLKFHTERDNVPNWQSFLLENIVIWYRTISLQNNLFYFLDSTIARLLQMQFRRKFKRQGTDDILGNLDRDSLNGYNDYTHPLKRTLYYPSDFGPKRLWKGYNYDRKLEEIEDFLMNDQERYRWQWRKTYKH